MTDLQARLQEALGAGYRVERELGGGGMSRVFLAEELDLGRRVVIKVLPPEMAAGVNVDRFRREIQLAAKLQHPHVVPLLTAGASGDLLYYVMPFIQGESLRAKLGREGELPIPEAVRILREVIDALAYAHRHGVVHRDIKPDNVLLSEGHAVVTDFGVAKAVSESTGAGSLTSLGVALGTPAYMAPEQAAADPHVDHRADLYAVGVLAYEMLCGRLPFSGPNPQALLAAHVTEAPEPAIKHRATMPEGLNAVVMRCLEKKAADRWQRAEELLPHFDALLTPSGGMTPTGATPVISSATEAAIQRAHPVRVAALFGLAAVGVLAIVYAVVQVVGLPDWAAPPAPRPVGRFTLTLGANERLALGPRTVLALSPDGYRLVYVASRNGTTQLYVREMDQPEGTAIPGTEGASGPFFSPDGQWLGFFAEGNLKKVSLTGGPPVTLESGLATRGAHWGPNGNIVFTPAYDKGLWQIPATGGSPEALTTLELVSGERAHRWPHILPGGTAVLFTIGTAGSLLDDGGIAVKSLKTGERRILVERGTYAQYVPTGHLVYARGGALMAAAFDPQRLELEGSPVPVLEAVMMEPGSGTAYFAFSNIGSLVYLAGGTEGADRILMWVDRKGAVRPLTEARRAYLAPRLSPEGQRLAMIIEEANWNLWVYDLARGTLVRLTFEANNSAAVWTPDGKHVTFSSSRAGPLNIFWQLADGSRGAEQLVKSEYPQFPSSWSPDGRVLAFHEINPTTGGDIWVMRRDGGRGAEPFLKTPSNEWGAKFSPDGRWLAFVSDESGREEVYVQPFPGPGRKWQISTEGGGQPLWAPNGRELFYRNGDKIMVAEVKTEGGFTAAKPSVLLEGEYLPGPVSALANYDLGPDGEWFVMIKGSGEESAPTQLNVVLEWFEDLKRRVPGTRK